ncbi:hypothetical protein Hdeb2414_s0024g00653911 [Helianthus debilis subsp. tardiflorus]
MKMNSIILFLFILQAIINGVNLVIAQPSKTDSHVCRGGDLEATQSKKTEILHWINS